MFIDNNDVWHIIMVCCVRSDIMFLIFNDGTKNAKYVAIKTNGGEQVKKRFTMKNRYI